MQQPLHGASRAGTAAPKFQIASESQTRRDQLQGLSVVIVICTHNRPALLERCLDSIAALETRPTRVLIVDNAPETDETRTIAARHGADYLLAPKKGLSRARNCGARACSENIIAYADDDMVLHPRWLTHLLSAFEDSSVSGVTGPFLPLEARFESESQLAERLSHMPLGSRCFSVDRSQPDWFERAHFGGVGDGNFAIRRSVLDQWSGFAERLGRGVPLDHGEDHFAFFELIERDNKFVYAPMAIVFHPEIQWTAQSRAAFRAQVVAYILFVSLTRPRYAMRMALYVAGGLLGVRRRWRNPSGARRKLASQRLPSIAMLREAVRILWQSFREARQEKQEMEGQSAPISIKSSEM
jgi:glycosyltransferase involved in cell wall biosynthesis